MQPGRKSGGSHPASDLPPTLPFEAQKVFGLGVEMLAVKVHFFPRLVRENGKS